MNEYRSDVIIKQMTNKIFATTFYSINITIRSRSTSPTKYKHILFIPFQLNKSRVSRVLKQTEIELTGCGLHMDEITTSCDI